MLQHSIKSFCLNISIYATTNFITGAKIQTSHVNIKDWLRCQLFIIKLIMIKWTAASVKTQTRGRSCAY